MSTFMLEILVACGAVNVCSMIVMRKGGRARLKSVRASCERLARHRGARQYRRFGNTIPAGRDRLGQQDEQTALASREQALARYIATQTRSLHDFVVSSGDFCNNNS